MLIAQVPLSSLQTTSATCRDFPLDHTCSMPPDLLSTPFRLIDGAKSLNFLAIVIDRGVFDLTAVVFPLQLDLGLQHDGSHLVPRVHFLLFG